MQSEDYIYQDDIALSKYPLSKKHVIAIAITAALASSLYFLLPQGQYRTSSTPVYGAIQGDQGDSSYEEILDPTRSLTDILLGGGHTIPASSKDVADSSSSDSISGIYTEEDIGSLENYDEGDLSAELAYTDESILNQSLQDAAAKDGGYFDENGALWVTEEIQPGDSLSSVFSDLNIPYNVTLAIANTETGSHSVTNLRPGRKLYFAFDKNNNLTGFVKQIDGDEQLHFMRKDVSTLTFEVKREPNGSHMMVIAEDGSFQPALEQLPDDQQPAYMKRGRLVVATIGQGESFSTAAHAAGLTYSEIQRITELFKGRVQFTRHIQPGDSVRVLFSDDKGAGKINAVELKLKKVGTLAAYRNVIDGHYYDENGYNSATSTFRRFPIDGKVVISSHFNPNRRHPVTGKVRPHNGTDFAVRIGTPVIAPADGVVELAKYSRTAGYYIILRHRGSYTTVYMHLSKLLVKPGQRVKIGEMIARSGNTGISTGPHLHYELRQNGRAINAMRVTLPANDDASVAQKNRQRFAANVEVFKKELYKDELIAQSESAKQ